MFNDNSVDHSDMNKSVFIGNGTSLKQLDKSDLNLTFDQDYIEKKRFKSLKLFNKCEFFRFINKNFPEVAGDYYEISNNLSKNISKDYKALYLNYQKTKLFLENICKQILKSNELFLTDDNLINICLILARAFIYSKQMGAVNKTNFFYLFDLDLQVLESIKESEKLKEEDMQIYTKNKCKKNEINDRKKITIFKSLTSLFTFGKSSSGSSNENENSNNGFFLNKELLRKNKHYNKAIHEDLTNLIESLYLVKSVHFCLPETENKFAFLFLFFINFELLLPNIYQINLDFEAKISNLNAVNVGMESGEFVNTSRHRMKGLLYIFYFISRPLKVNFLRVVLPDSFLEEVDFILKEEKILLSDFHYLDMLIESYKELNKLHFEFNSLDNITFDRIMQLLINNNMLQSIYLKLFNPNNDNVNINNLRNFSNMIIFEDNLFPKDRRTTKSSNKVRKKEIIIDEGSYFLSLIFKPFAANLEKLILNLIERKGNLKFISINFEMPNYLSLDDKYIELFQKNIFLFLEKISAAPPKQTHKFNFQNVKGLNSASKLDDIDKNSIFSELLRKRSLENTKKKISFSSINANCNESAKDSHSCISNLNFSNSNKGNNDNNTNNTINNFENIINESKNKNNNKDYIFNKTIGNGMLNMNNNSNNNINHNSNNKEEMKKSSYYNIGMGNFNYYSNPNVNQIYISENNKKFENVEIIENSSSKNYEESIISFDETNDYNKFIAIQSLELCSRNFILDTRKYQIIEKKFQYINLRENNLLNLTLDFKIFKFSEILFTKLFPKRIEDLKISDLDFDSLKGLKIYFCNRKLNSLLSLEVSVSNFLNETNEDQDLLIDFISIFKGDRLEEFTLKTKVNFPQEKLTQLLDQVNGDYVKKFSLSFFSNKISFDTTTIKDFKLFLQDKPLKAYHLPQNFREMKAFLIKKIINSNLNIIVNDIYSLSINHKNTSNTSKSNSDNKFNNQLIFYGRDQQITLLKNIRKTVDNIRSFLKIRQDKIFTVDFLEHNPVAKKIQ